MINRNYYIRQSGLIDATKLNFPILVVGAGGIGGWTTLALCKMGCQDVRIEDFDVVEEHNLGSQLFSRSQIGMDKAAALWESVSNLAENPPRYFKHRVQNREAITGRHGIVISAVDNMESRRAIFDGIAETKYFIDGRMAGNAIQIYTIKIDNLDDVGFYKSTLFSDDQADQVPCSERAVIYNVFVVAGLITDIVAQIANGLRPPRELVVDLRNFTLHGGLI